MKYVEDILGFTFAEIAFLLLFIIFAGYMINSRFLSANMISMDELEKKDKKIALLKNELNELQRRVLKNETLRSRAKPNCIEIGFHKDFLFTVTIMGAETYQINSHSYNFDLLFDSFKSEIDKAKKRGCVPSIKVGCSPYTSVQEYDIALRRLEQYFYTMRLDIEYLP